MRIAVIGAGAMGAMFGARFARAGAEVVLFDKDAAHVAAINADGVTVEGRDGDLHMRLAATTDPAAIGAVDMALVMVDGNATAAAAAMLADVLPEAAFVLTLQNGIGNVEALTAALGEGRVMAGSTYNSGARLGPGKVAHTNVGRHDHRRTGRARDRAARGGRGAVRGRRPAGDGQRQHHGHGVDEVRAQRRDQPGRAP